MAVGSVVRDRDWEVFVLLELERKSKSGDED